MSQPRIPWLLECTTHWPRVRAKFLFYAENRPVRDEDGVVTAFRDGQVTLRENRRTEGFTIAILEQGYQGVRVGDLVLHSMDAFAGAIGVSESDGKCTPEYVVVNGPPRKVENRYYAYLLREMALRDYIRVICPSVRERAPRFRFPRFQEVMLPAPPVPVQRAIADFLDRKTALIDDLIAKKERLLGLMAEKRAALIHRAVTKGLDPSVPMKDSGVPWIGEIPAHWNVRRMRYLCRITTGGRDTQDAREDGAYPFFVRSDTVERIDTYSFDGEAVLTSGDGAGVGKIFHHYVGKLEFHQRVYLFYAFHEVLGRYLYFFVKQHLATVVLEGTAKSTVDSIRRHMLTDFPIAFGPEDEQAAIVSFLDRALDRSDKVLARVEEQIDRLREYRQALITAAVTGQLDVEGGRSGRATSAANGQLDRSEGAP